MEDDGLLRRTLDAASSDVLNARTEFDDALTWLRTAVERDRLLPLAAEVWALDPSRTRVLLVRHRWRGWVAPGGKVDPGESPREAAARELLEETGMTADLPATPTAVSVRSYRPDWSPTLGIAFGTVLDPDVPLSGEAGQPAAWIPLSEDWETTLPEDRARIRAFAATPR